MKLLLDVYTLASFAIENGEIESTVLEGFKIDITAVFA